MNAFWSGFFGHFQECGRTAAWFIMSLGLVLVGLIVAAWAMNHHHETALVVVLTIAAILLLKIFLGAVVSGWRERKRRLKFRGLSEDELKKAREKLVRRANPKSISRPTTLRAKMRPSIGEVY
ncbi:MAG: hypothetical protein U1F65_00775 [Verrucomicrobiota bacterium]